MFPICHGWCSDRRCAGARRLRAQGPARSAAGSLRCSKRPRKGNRAPARLPAQPGAQATDFGQDGKPIAPRGPEEKTSRRLADRLKRAMHHFAYRAGVLHAEAVNLETLAAAVGTPFYCYSSATLDAPLPRVRRRVRRRAGAGVLRGQGQFQPGGDRDARQARRGRRRGFRGRAQARARGRRAGGKNHVLRHRQDRARARAGDR